MKSLKANILSASTLEQTAFNVAVTFAFCVTDSLQVLVGDPIEGIHVINEQKADHIKKTEEQ
jgi:hypothetical protein